MFLLFLVFFSFFFLLFFPQTSFSPHLAIQKKGEFVNCHWTVSYLSSSVSRSRCGVAIASRLWLGSASRGVSGCRSGFDIEGASRPVVVPIPQTGIAGTLNLSEELFPDGKQRRYEIQIEGKETDCRAESK